jgi:DNA-nicking Smr family endonuclease
MRVVRIIHGKGKNSEGKLPVLKGSQFLATSEKRSARLLLRPSQRRRDGGGVCVVEAGLIYITEYRA